MYNNFTQKCNNNVAVRKVCQIGGAPSASEHLLSPQIVVYISMYSMLRTIIRVYVLFNAYI